jgi:hypothetical protein
LSITSRAAWYFCKSAHLTRTVGFIERALRTVRITPTAVRIRVKRVAYIDSSPVFTWPLF